jgi:hypothetical protein
VCLCAHSINVWKPEQIYTKSGMYIMAPDHIFLNPAHQSVCLYVYPPVVASQRLGKNVTATTNTYATVEELLDASFSILSVSYQRKVRE